MPEEIQKLLEGGAKKNEHKSWTITINTQNASKNGREKFANGDGKGE